MKVNNQTVVSEILFNCEANLLSLRRILREDYDDSPQLDEQSQIINDYIKTQMDRIDKALKQLKKL
jgi:SpoVK/Ycf46/Vps4 family AAA+-type ATPase